MATKLTIELPDATIETLRELIRPIIAEIAEEPTRREPPASPVSAAPVKRDPPPVRRKRRPSTRSSTPEGWLNIHEVSARTGHSPDRIRHLRVKGHELYSLAWKNGDTQGSRLLFDERAVDAWVESQRTKSIRPEVKRHK